MRQLTISKSKKMTATEINLTKRLSHLVKEESLNGIRDDLPELTQEELEEVESATLKFFKGLIIKSRIDKHRRMITEQYAKKIEAETRAPQNAEELMQLVVKKYGPLLA